MVQTKIQVLTTDRGRKLLGEYCKRHGYLMTHGIEKLFEEKKQAYKIINDLRCQLKEVNKKLDFPELNLHTDLLTLPPEK